MAQYLLAVHSTEEDHAGTSMPAEEMQAAFAAVDAFNQRITAEGVWVFGGGLEAASTATVVDNRGDAPVVTDGPYLEGKEHIGGFWIVDVADLDAALELAKEASAACREQVEVRPFQSE